MSQLVLDHDVSQREHPFTERELLQQIQNLYQYLLARAHTSMVAQNDDRYHYFLHVYYELKELINYRLHY